MEPVLTKGFDDPKLRTLEGYMARGGYEALKKALAMQPDELITAVKESGLRGRGGAGFPTGVKWGFISKEAPTVYLCCNADESEPGTFKDRYLINGNPHQLIEGMLITCLAIRSQVGYCFLRGEFWDEWRLMDEALEEARKAGIVGANVLGSGKSIDIWTHRSAGAYICGEETGLLESLEGKRAYPRIKPPFPAIVGLFGKPTIINNVETLCCIPHIVSNGPQWFRDQGINGGAGPKLYCVSGHVTKPGVFELPTGVPLLELINVHAGGMRPGHTLKAVFPGGSSSPVLTAAEADVIMDFDPLMKAGTMFGSAGTIVMDDTTNMVDVLLNLAHFYSHESCGQCTPCREGTLWTKKIAHRLHEGHGDEEDLATLASMWKNMAGRTICVLADALTMPAESVLRKFRSEIEASLARHGASAAA